ncbi:MAG: nucleoside triphosphate pyrophosphohydrolase, partial [Oscillospiraceae bacterium]|nr:nucleoside triphosphate pyrophosphohydrolase [Oscillospiraceae bacterium]
NWDALKRKEKEQQTQTDALRAVAKTLPALWRAEKLQHKAAKAGVRQSSTDAALRVTDRADALQRAVSETPDSEAAGRALGDLLFAAVGLGDVLDLDCEALLTAASERFLSRFAETEAAGAPLNASLLEG